jgi:hypothetical protein
MMNGLTAGGLVGNLVGDNQRCRVGTLRFVKVLADLAGGPSKR